MFGQDKSEIELIQASQQGNPQAFEAIVCKYQSLVCAITYSGTGSKDQSEELAQEILLLAWKNLKNLREPSKFQAWLCTIARNTVQNWRRTCGRQQAGRATHLGEATHQAASTAEPVDTAIQQEQEAVVNQALDHIPEKYREPLILFYRESKSVRDVAALLSLSENTARQRISRARRLLKDKVSRMVETTLSHSRPGKAFTTAVMSSLAAGTLKTTATTAAVAGTAVILKGMFSGLAAKLAVTAAAVVIVTGGGLWWHQKQSESVDQTREVTVQPAEEQIDALQAPVENANSDIFESIEAPASGTQPRNPDQPAMASEQVTSKTTPETQPSDAPLPVLQGTLTDIDTGKPIPLAKIRMTQRSEGRVYQTVTDSHGTYAFGQVDKDGTYDLHPEPVEYITEDPWEPPKHSVELHSGRTRIKDYALEKGCRVELNAIDEKGHPIKGAEFHAVYVTNVNGRGPKETVTTDSKGLAIIRGLRPEAYLIVGAHRDYALAGQRITFTTSQEDLSLVIEMKKGLEVKGMATCSDGMPASGWRVEPKPAWWHSSLSWPFDDPVAEDGTFVFRHIDPGLHRVVVSRPFGSATISVWETDVDLPSETGLLALAIPQPSSHSRASISGSIVFQGEAPVQGFSIDAFSKPGYFGHVRWEPNEPTFTISDLVPGSYDLTFTPPGGKRQTLNNIQAPSHDIVLEIQTDTLIPILGQVVDKLSGQPVTDFQVRQINQETWRQCEDPNGFFTLTQVGSGLQQVVIRSQGYTDTLSDEITPGLTESLRIELEMPEVIHGRVIDSAGAPIEGVEIDYRFQRSRNQSPDDMKITQSDGQGYFDLPIVLANKTREWFVFQHPDFARAFQKLDLEEDLPEQISVVMPRGGAIQGHLYDVAGKPLPDAPLYVMDENSYSYWKDNRGRLGMIFTDENGFFYMDHLPEELCYVFRQDPDRQLGTVLSAILPKEGQTRTLNIGGPWHASGRLLHHGHAHTNVRIMASFSHDFVQGFEAKTVTDVSGNFSFYGLPTGKRWLYVSPAGKDDWLALGEFDFVAGQDQELGDWHVTLAETAVALIHEDQTLLADGWDVQIRQYSEQSFWGRRIGQTKTRQNQEAPFVFTGLPAGRFEVVASREGYPGIRQSFEIQPEQETQSVTLILPKGSAEVTGQVTFASDPRSTVQLTLWNADQTLVQSFPVSDYGTFELERLPAGDYVIGRAGLIGRDRFPILHRFHLNPDEKKALSLYHDPDKSIYSGDGYLIVLVVDEQGIPVATPDVWLEQNGHIIVPHFNTDDGKSFAGDPGSYVLHAEHPGFHPSQKVITMASRLERAQNTPGPVVMVLTKLKADH